MPAPVGPVPWSPELAALVAVASGLAAAVAAVPLHDRVPDPRTVATRGGALYAGALLFVWAATRLVANGLPTGVADPLTAAGTVLLGGFVLAGHAAVPYYTYARFGYVLPFVWFVPATMLVCFEFLQVDPGNTLATVTLGFAWLSALFSGLLAAAEGGFRHLAAGRITY